MWGCITKFPIKEIILRRDQNKGKLEIKLDTFKVSNKLLTLLFLTPTEAQGVKMSSIRDSGI